MKYLKISKYVGLSIFALVLFYSCKKIKTDEPIGDGGQQIIRIMTFGSKEALPFAKSAVTLDLAQPSYDLQFVLEYSSSQVPTSDVTVTLGFDAAALTAFNAAQPAGGIIYLPLTAAQYSLPATTTKFRAGQGISEPFTIRFYPNQLDPSKSYMIPISITNIAGAPGGIVKAPASSTAYFHIIGNSLAGKYSWRYRRWQSGDTTTAPLQDILTTTNLLPISASKLMTRETYTETFVDPGNGIVLEFTESGGVLSGFNTSLLPSTTAGIAAGGFTLTGGPKFTGGGVVVVGNAASSYIGTQFGTYIQYLNSSGGTRTLVNSFTKIP